MSHQCEATPRLVRSRKHEEPWNHHQQHGTLASLTDITYVQSAISRVSNCCELLKPRVVCDIHEGCRCWLTFRLGCCTWPNFMPNSKLLSQKQKPGGSFGSHPCHPANRSAKKLGHSDLIDGLVGKDHLRCKNLHPRRDNSLSG